MKILYTAVISFLVTAILFTICSYIFYTPMYAYPIVSIQVFTIINSLITICVYKRFTRNTQTINEVNVDITKLSKKQFKEFVERKKILSDLHNKDTIQFDRTKTLGEK